MKIRGTFVVDAKEIIEIPDEEILGLSEDSRRDKIEEYFQLWVKNQITGGYYDISWKMYNHK